MFNGKKILAIIPARGGSKGIKNKNITDLGGKPLIQYTIDEARKAKYIDRIIVSTDSIEIKKVSEKLGAEVPFLRPAELAKDTTESIEVALHALDSLKFQKEFYDYVILFQPTSPLRKAFHINEAIEKAINLETESLVSVCEVDETPILMRRIVDNKLVKIIEYNGKIRRQDYPVFYKINGAMYINKVNMLYDQRVFVNDDTVPYIMDKRYSIDIDTEADLKSAELQL